MSLERRLHRRRSAPQQITTEESTWSQKRRELARANGKHNFYTCQTCNQVTHTVDLDLGVTPFMLRCRATPGCAGMAQSSLYRVMPEDAERVPIHGEWFRPILLSELGLLFPDRHEYAAMLDHVQRGGLLLREISAEGE